MMASWLRDSFHSPGVLKLVDSWLQEKHSSFDDPVLGWDFGRVFWKFNLQSISLVLPTIHEPLNLWISLFLLKLDTVGSVLCIWTQSYRASILVSYQIFPALRGALSSPWSSAYGSRCWDRDWPCVSLPPWVTTVNKVIWRPIQWTRGTREEKPLIKAVDIGGKFCHHRIIYLILKWRRTWTLSVSCCFNNKITPKICGTGLTAGQRESRKLFLKMGGLEIHVF